MSRQRALPFDDRDYRRSHMKAPRGTGSWAFQAIGDTGLRGDIVFFFGTLTDAKRQATAHFADQDLAGDIQGIAILA